MRATKRAGRGSVALAVGVAAVVLAAAAAAQPPIATQQVGAGLSIGSVAQPTLFSSAGNAECEASPSTSHCASYTITVRNEGGRETGIAKVGDTETCAPGSWSAASPPTEFEYEWLRELQFGLGGYSTKVVGTGPTYTINGGPPNTANDEGFAITCRVTATNAAGSTVVHSQPLRVEPLPTAGSGAAFGLPTTLDSSGGHFSSPEVHRVGSIFLDTTASVGESLVCDPGEWTLTGTDGGIGSSLAYRWLVNGVPLNAKFKEEAGSLEVPAGAEAKAIQCEVGSVLGASTVQPQTGVFAASVNRVAIGVGAESAPWIGSAGEPQIAKVTLSDTPAISGVELKAKDILPPGVTAEDVEGQNFASHISPSVHETQDLPCDLGTLTCSVPVSLRPGEGFQMQVLVTVQQAGGEIGANTVDVSGGSIASRSSAEEPPGKVVSASIGEGDPPFSVRGFSLQPFSVAGLPDTQAGDRPNTLSTGIQLPTVPPGGVPADGANARDIRVTLPPGLVGNPLAAERCLESDVTHLACPTSSQVGALNFVEDSASFAKVGDEFFPLFNTVPEAGYPAELGSKYLTHSFELFANLVRAPVADGGYTIQVTSTAPLTTPISTALITVFGDPRGRLSGARGPAFLTNSSACGLTPTATIEADSWQETGSYKKIADVPVLPPGQTITGCELLQFGPSIAFEPETARADSPSGYRFELVVPQSPDVYPILATPPLKDATVTLPEGLVPNPAQADGLAGCTPQQIDVEGEAIDGFGHEDGEPHLTPGNCPLASKIGTVAVATPVLDHAVEGSVYLGTPECSPCGNEDAQSGKLIRLYIEAKDKQAGVVVKLLGHATLDPQSGRVRASFEDNPQFPVSRFSLNFKGGPRAALANPQACGTHTTTSDLKPWSAPQTPDATPSAEFSIDSGANGGACVSGEAAEPNAPSFEAGTTQPLAGSYAPFVMRLSRADGTQRLKQLDLALPPGLTGKLAGVQECSDAAIAAAGSKSGAAEKASASCPASSEVGTVTVGAGAGSSPYYTSGKAYLAGPYKGAPLSLAVITPAVAGPFDLGTVVVRAALHVNPRTAQVSAVSDEIPHILAGIPLDVRSIAFKLDRDQFTLNPTSCEAMAISGRATALGGDVAELTNRFQVGGCKGLDFAPRLGLRLFGKTGRGAHPRFRALLRMKSGEANISRAAVTLPRSEFLDQAHIRTICTRVQFAAGSGNGAQCPKGSVYGHAKAWTPLLDAPLSGPVYLRSSNHKLPDLVAVLGGQITVELAGTIDSVHGGIRNRFEVVPDAPVSKFMLTMQGGKKGLLVNSRNVCAHTYRATARFTAQNRMARNLRPALRNSRCGKAERKHHRRHRRHGR